MTPPKGKRKSNAETYRDAMAMVRLVDKEGLEVEDAARQLGLTRSTAYRLLSRARSLILAPQVEADRKAAEPAVKRWYEPIPSPEPEAAPTEESKPLAALLEREVKVPDVAEMKERPEVPEMKLPPVEPVRPPVVKPPPDTSEAGRRREWRRQQVEKQMEENGHQLTFRGRQKSAWEGDDHLEY